MPNFISEDDIEQAMVQRLEHLYGYGHDIEHNFKDPDHPLQLVFVCAMWLTGFDAPTVSTLYLDKPQKDHTIMQTIARANRVTSHKINGVEKRSGEVADYYGVFRSLRNPTAPTSLMISPSVLQRLVAQAGCRIRTSGSGTPGTWILCPGAMGPVRLALNWILKKSPNCGNYR